ncbi:cell division protein SepF [Macrococcus brunensis]|uniref:Cell division protein SepF n=1 Tax=Macrococcus brunensis TaxID=198483 RepID=A0A4R6BG09_9STAP|nr:cell division protein SepF [Macrococcus brunensis]TDL98769.1 cell division protein SepF [Macrococcus brunensis]ULG72803.1 cell division protein SepF [Macrococcus brunensis]ULG75052.1 cell division protein SepF [Macrococcus brunensis]
MAIKDVFKGFFVIDDEDNDNEIYSSEDTREERLRAQPVQKQTAPAPVKQVKTTTEKRVVKPNVVNIKPEPASASSKMCLFEPRVFSDTQDIADELKNRRATLVNLQRIDKISAKRIIDFLSGTVYAIGGDIQRIGQDIFLCTPDNVEVAGSITEMLDAPEEEE